MAGILGSSRKKEYTVMGSTVNVASRLEKLARGGQILVCGDTYSEVRDIVRAENMEPVVLKGIDRKIAIYNIVGLKEKTP